MEKKKEELEIDETLVGHTRLGFFIFVYLSGRPPESIRLSVESFQSVISSIKLIRPID